MIKHKHSILSPTRLFLFGIVLVLGASLPAVAQQRVMIERPGEREFVRDIADMLSAEDEQHISSLCDSLLTDNAIPIIVVTIDRMANYGGQGMRIEQFAQVLYDQWEIGHEELGGEYWNRGVLLLVSRDDRKARIELGAGWDRQANPVCQQIMDEQIVARFKQGRFSAGIVAGVEALDKISRGETLPKKPIPRSQIIWAAILTGLAIFTVFSLIRRGASGWAWLFWGVVFSFIGYMLYNAMRNSGGGGGFSGGSFGGGFSGGGGASGSW